MGHKVLKVLVVDDEESASTVIRGMLSEAGYFVREASNGQEAIRIMSEEHLDAVVTDLRMPRINGLRFIRALRARGDTVPIIAISGTNRDQLVLAHDYGANAALAKPIDRDELLEVLEKALADTRDGWSDVWIHPEFGSVGDR